MMSDQDDPGGPDLSDAESEALLDMLGQAIEDTNAVPPWLSRFARESHRLISFESELAEIVSDSLLAAPAGTRSTSGPRTIEFNIDAVTIVLDVDGDTVRGSIEPTASEFTLVTDHGEQTIAVNERNFFTFAAPSGPCRLLASFDDRHVKTDWITLG